MNFATELSDGYVAVWNEGNPERRAMVADLWAPDGEHLLVPVRGHRELNVRVANAYEQFVGAGEYHFGAGRMPSGSVTWSSSDGRWSRPRTARSPGSDSNSW